MEQMILSWLSNNIATVATWIVGLGAVSVAIKKYGPKIRKFIKIGSEALDVVDILLDALTDDKVTDEEIKKILEEVNQFKEAVK